MEKLNTDDGPDPLVDVLEGVASAATSFAAP
jgi:hypothetical protein